LSSQEYVAVLDFGSQYTQLIARRVREAHVYCELFPHDVAPETLDRANLKGVILSGGPASVYDPMAPPLAAWLQQTDVPLLAVCYGMQLLAHNLGGKVEPAHHREYGHTLIAVSEPHHPFFAGVPESLDVWMSHGDRVDQLPAGYRPIATSDNCAFAAMADGRGNVGVQFHPEVVHTAYGRQLLQNFLYRICGCSGSWTADRYVDDHVAAIRDQLQGETAICALSGGVDSAVAATLVDRAIGDRLTCVFVDTGLLRQGEFDEVMEGFKDLDLNVRTVDAAAEFLDRLAGVEDPEEKRRRIGALFIDVFAREARELNSPAFLVQGTLYPDVIESATRDNPFAAKIKTHHNVGGLPESLPFKLVEPLRYLFKDEVREVGRALHLPPGILQRHPFPGPGLAVRILGEVTPERLEVLRAADAVVTQEINRAGLYDDVWQAFAVLTPMQTVGVMGDGRTYGNVVAIRAVTSEDAMTADWARLPYEVLAAMSARIVNEVAGVNRVVYDVSSKPPATIEWE
jgi:GMP synthase (glutamine-hydrolysing)